MAEGDEPADQSDAALDPAGEASANEEQAIDVPREVVKSIAASLVKVWVVRPCCVGDIGSANFNTNETNMLPLDSK
jgi:hypothetical protein